MRCRMNFVEDTVQTQTPKLVDLGFLTINSLDEGNALSTLDTRIQSPADGSHCSAPDRVFGGTTSFGVSEPYHYKTEFQIWKEIKEFERQNISMGQPHLESTPIGTNTPNSKISPLKSSPVGEKIPDLKPLTLPMESPK